MRHAGRNVGGTERGELLLGVDVVAVFLRKASGDRDCFAVGEQEASERHRHQLRDVCKVDFGKADLRQAEGEIADHLYARRG